MASTRPRTAIRGVGRLVTCVFPPPVAVDRLKGTCSSPTVYDEVRAEGFAETQETGLKFYLLCRRKKKLHNF
jgi:hypothetical protein